jgi:predicted PurR-regulated permease PerM
MPAMQKHLFISDRLFRAAVFTAAVVIVIAGVITAESIITMLLLAFFFSVISAHLVSWLDEKKVPHILSVIIVMVGILLLILGLSSIIGGSITSFTAHLGKYENRLTGIITSINQEFASTLGQLGNVMSNTTLIFFIVLFVLLEMRSISLKSKIFGSSSVGKTLKNITRIEKSVRHYLVIKTIISLLTGVLIWIWLSIIGVEYAVLWALIAFLLNYIPNIGSIIAAIPTMLFSWIQLGFIPMIWVAVGYVAVNLSIGYFIEPRAMGRGMGLSTLVVFLSLIIWGYILGIVGMFLSVPLTMTLKIILEYNDSTKHLAAMLGTDEEALKLINEKELRNLNNNSENSDNDHQ